MGRFGDESDINEIAFGNWVSERTMGLMVATKAFFKLLTDRDLSASFDDFSRGNMIGKNAVQAGDVSDSRVSEKPSPSDSTQPQPTSKRESGRSDAVSLLAALQREARLLDLVYESLDGYTDAQIGGAARDVLRDTQSTLQRMFELVPGTDVQDGNRVQTPVQFDPAEYRLTGDISGDGPFEGALSHHGWKATKCNVPTYTGAPASAMIVAPIELEVN